MNTQYRFALTLFCAGLLGATSSSWAMNPANRAVPANEITFEQVAPFVKMGGAWGDRALGSHGTFGEFPGNAASPPHTHSGAYHAVVITGTMTNPFEGEKSPTEMVAGSYWYVPAGVEHITACVSIEPCLFYFHAESGFDFTPVE